MQRAVPVTTHGGRASRLPRTNAGTIQPESVHPRASLTPAAPRQTGQRIQASISSSLCPVPWPRQQWVALIALGARVTPAPRGAPLRRALPSNTASAASRRHGRRAWCPVPSADCSAPTSTGSCTPRAPPRPAPPTPPSSGSGRRAARASCGAGRRGARSCAPATSSRSASGRRCARPTRSSG